MRTPNFVIALKNEKLKTYTTISWLIIILNLIAFIYTGITRQATIDNLPYFAAGLLLIIFACRWIVKGEVSENGMIGLSFSIVIVTWLIIQSYWIAVIILFLFIIQEISRRKLIVRVFEDGINYPSFPKRMIEWNELNNVILKDGLLTIDLKSNKVFQNETLSVVYEPEFNEFCHSRIQAL
ncbi:MAG: hypothetical protein WDO16_24695 [Bacteroidota bacterium]